ncbi:hypothetical protein SAMN05444748_110113 [Variovorax sp. OV700]|nr:hypothetical protein SAMN05444748_110113 [Variovorax sp. OV700]
MRSLLFLRFRGRDIRPAAASLSFASPKESKQRKGDPTVCVPPLRCGQPAVLDSGGGPQNSLRSNSCGPDPACICAPRRIQKGWEPTGHRFARPNPNPTAKSIRTPAARSAAGAWWPSEAKARSVSKPLCMRRGAQGFADQGRSCLSEASSADPAKREHRRLPRSAAQGSQTVGSPFFCLRFFGEAKKSRSPAGATPGLGKQAPVCAETGASQ